MHGGNFASIEMYPISFSIVDQWSFQRSVYLLGSVSAFALSTTGLKKGLCCPVLLRLSDVLCSKSCIARIVSTQTGSSHRFLHGVTLPLTCLCCCSGIKIQAICIFIWSGSDSTPLLSGLLLRRHILFLFLNLFSFPFCYLYFLNFWFVILFTDWCSTDSILIHTSQLLFKSFRWFVFQRDARVLSQERRGCYQTPLLTIHEGHRCQVELCVSTLWEDSRCQCGEKRKRTKYRKGLSSSNKTEWEIVSPFESAAAWWDCFLASTTDRLEPISIIV